MLEINKTHLMSNIDGMNAMDAESVDLIVTSPPYDNLRSYNDSSSWNFETFKLVADAAIRVLKPGGVIAWNFHDEGEHLVSCLIKKNLLPVRAKSG